MNITAVSSPQPHVLRSVNKQRLCLKMRYLFPTLIVFISPTLTRCFGGIDRQLERIYDDYKSGEQFK